MYRLPAFTGVGDIKQDETKGEAILKDLANKVLLPWALTPAITTY